jgi:oxygen-dependent protoporphyrinogen oxidase
LGDRIACSSPVHALHREGDTWVVTAGDQIRSRHVVFANGVKPMADLTGIDATPPPMAPVAVAWLGGDEATMPLPDGFGILTSPDLGTATLGILLESSFAPARAPQHHTLAKIIAGGATRPELVDKDDAEIIETLGSETARIVGSSLEASFTHVVRHAGIPQYTRGHGERVAAIEAQLDPGLHVVGWEYRGIGMSQLGADAKKIATQIEADLAVQT